MPARLPLAFRLILGPELDLWSKAGHAPIIWWRDDDARAPTGALERLLDLSRRHNAPLTLAAIAGPELAQLVRRVSEGPPIEIAVHGFTHVNRQPEGAGFGEIIDSDTVEDVRERLDATIAAFHQAGAMPTLFVPPWNNLSRQLLAALPGSALTAVSAFDQAMDETDAVPRIDAHLDVLRWKGGARFRGRWKFLTRMRRLLAHRRTTGAWDEPIGLLTHHLDHDHQTWRFLETFLMVFPIVPRRAVLDERGEARFALSA